MSPPGLLERGKPLLDVAGAVRQENVLGAVVEDHREGVCGLGRETFLFSQLLISSQGIFDLARLNH